MEVLKKLIIYGGYVLITCTLFKCFFSFGDITIIHKWDSYGTHNQIEIKHIYPYGNGSR